MSTQRPTTARSFRVALEGFSEPEREMLRSFFRLADGHTPVYALVPDPAQSDLLVVDADQPPVLQRIVAERRVSDAVFVGKNAPAHAIARVARPIEPTRVRHGLDQLVAQRTVRIGLDLELPMTAPGCGAEPQEVDLLLHDITRPDANSDGTRRPGYGGGRSALVVDDSAIARKFLTARLQRLGYAVHATASGEQALEMAARERFAIVFLDVGLGSGAKLDGLQVCQRIHQLAQQRSEVPPAIVLIADAGTGPSERVRGSLVGCDGYLTKPLLEPEFLDVLASVDPTFRHPLVGAVG